MRPGEHPHTLQTQVPTTSHDQPWHTTALMLVSKILLIFFTHAQMYHPVVLYIDNAKHLYCMSILVGGGVETIFTQKLQANLINNNKKL